LRLAYIPDGIAMTIVNYSIISKTYDNAERIMKTPANDNDHKTSTAASPAVWLAEGQSSQRDMLASLQTLKNHADTSFNIIASHRHNRPEIFEFADSVYREPSTSTADNDEQTVLESVEPLMPRWQFVLEVIDDKFAFMQQCHEHDIPVAEAWRFDNVAELEALLATYGHQPLCVKPVTGIFAQGFWRLSKVKEMGKEVDEQYDSFEHLYFTEEKKINTAQFINAYANSVMVQERPIPMLLMPYLSGQEYSIDVVCEYGEVLAAVTRYKTGKIQHIGYEQAVMDVVIPLIKAFGCDGIVSVQTKADDDGQHRVLEINSRPSGGIDYTTHSGVDLTQVGFAYWLGLTDKPILADIAQQITPCQVRSIMVGVKVEEDITE